MMYAWLLNITFHLLFSAYYDNYDNYDDYDN